MWLEGPVEPRVRGRDKPSHVGQGGTVIDGDSVSGLSHLCQDVQDVATWFRKLACSRAKAGWG